MLKPIAMVLLLLFATSAIAQSPSCALADITKRATFPPRALRDFTIGIQGQLIDGEGESHLGPGSEADRARSKIVEIA